MGIVTKIEPDGRLRFPEELSGEFAPDQEVLVTRHNGGLLITPVRNTRLLQALQPKLKMRNPLCLDLSDLDMDELGL